MKKTVLILYTSHDARPNSPFLDLKYQRCYETLYTLAETFDMSLCRAPLDWYDVERDEFSDSWGFRDGVWYRTGAIKPDVVFDKTSRRSLDDPIRALIISRYRFMDDPAFTRFANDKYETSRRLPQHFKPYQKLLSATEYHDFLNTFTGNRLVIKPLDGSGGRGVHIVSKEEARQLTLTFPLLIQEFIDSSKGIPGITNTYHDLRMTFIGNELIYAYIRTPKEGSLLANLAQGGGMRVIPNSALPITLHPIIKDSQELFAAFHQKIYTIDAMFDETGRPWIIEYNTMPGLFFPPEEDVLMRRVYSRLLEEIKKFSCLQN